MTDKPHDSWAEVYDEAYKQSFGPLYTMLTKTSLKIIQEKTKLGTEILDVGAGTGRLSIPLLLQGHSVCAVDASAKMLDVLKSKDAKQAIRTVHCPIQDLDLNQTFDTVLCVFSVFCYLTNLQDLKGAIQSISRHTSTTGYALIDVPSSSSFSGLCYDSETLSRQVDVTSLDPETGLFEYSEKIRIIDTDQDFFYEDSFPIRYWSPEVILAEFDAAGMRVQEDVSERFSGSGAHYFLLGVN